MFPGTVRPARAGFFKYFAGQVPMDRAPGRTRVHEHAETGKPLAAYKLHGTRRRIREKSLAGPIARHGRANASGGTAPPRIPVCTPATKTCRRGSRHGWPQTLCNWVTVSYSLFCKNFAAARRPQGPASARQPAHQRTHGSSLPHIPSPSGLARLHPTLPQVPAGRRRWAERYDGKGNLYLQHAA